MNFNDLDDNLVFDMPAKAEPKIDTNKLAIRSDITKVSDVLTEFDRVSDGLEALATKYPVDLVFDVTTGAGMAEAKEHRAAWRDPRQAVERLRKQAKAPVLALGKSIDARAEWLTAQLLIGETPIDEQIKAEEARKEADKQARINAEFGRVQAIQDAIGEIHMQAMAAAGKASEVIFAASLHLAAMELDPLVFQEQIPQAEAARTAAIAKLEVAYKAALHSEAVTAKAAADRAELETLRAAAAAEQRRQDAAVIVQRAEQARIADQQRAEQAEIAALRKQLAEERAALDAAEAKRRQDEQGTRDAEALSDGRLGWKSVPALLASNLPDALPPEASAEPAIVPPAAPEPVTDAVAPVAETQATAAVETTPTPESCWRAIASGEKVVQLDIQLAACRAALTEALWLLEGWIAAKCPKKYEVKQRVKVAELRLIGGLPSHI